jgi:S-adenosylmethionine hydrolase
MTGPPPSGIVSLLSDFGLDDPYVGILKGSSWVSTRRRASWT